jgi:hypothetical protein
MVEGKCRVANCKRPYRARGYCVTHFKLWRRGEMSKPRYKICSKEGCRKAATARYGLCPDHFQAEQAGTAAS